MIYVTDTITLKDWEYTENFIRASGPGGQNVNKVSTAVELRFEAARSPSLPPEIKSRLRKLAGRKWTKDGAILIVSDQYRSQALNREAVRERLVALIQAALIKPKKRIKTKPTRGSIERRLEKKSQRSTVKSLRRNSMKSDPL